MARPAAGWLERRGLAPKLWLALAHYDRRQAAGDLVAGVTVGLVALPLAMAFAISSGLPPQAGIYTAIVAGFLISALGGSRTQIGGPTGAFVVVVAGIVAEHGVDGLFMCTVMAGVLLVVLGLTGLGTAVKFIPRPVVIGFTNGIAVLIASTQINDFFGLRIDTVPGEFLPRMLTLAAHAVDLFADRDRARGSAALAIMIVLTAVLEAHSRLDRGAGAGTVGGGALRLAGRDHRHALRRHSERPAASRISRRSVRS